MKKIILILTLGFLVTSIVIAASSATMVFGYVKTKTPTSRKYKLISVTSFGTNDSVHIQAAIPNVGDLNASTRKRKADKIFIWNGRSYRRYGLYNDHGTNAFWMAFSSSGWHSSAQAHPADVILLRQDAVFFKTGRNGASHNIVFAGNVRNDKHFDVSVGGGLSLLAYPFTSSINLTDLVVSNATASRIKRRADKISFYDGTSYKRYALYDDHGTNSFWMLTSSIGWRIRSQAAPTSVEIPLGTGFWYTSVDGAKTIGFDQNYTLDGYE